MNATIRLFKAVEISEKGKKRKISDELLKATVKHGFLFSPEVISNYHDEELSDLIKVVSKEVGISGKQLNSSFHKSWAKVRDASIEQLVIEQICHYITTYGYEAFGMYDKETVYIPFEELKVPKIKLDVISLVIIKGYTKTELKNKLINFLGSGIALKEDTKRDALDVATYVWFTEAEILAVKNKEVRCALYDLLDRIPEDPAEFLRFSVYKATASTLLIKNPSTIAAIKENKSLAVLGLFIKYQTKYGLEKLSEIFYRFKPLFLAFRNSPKMKNIINRIRKHAVNHHKPMPIDLLNNITGMVSRGEGINERTFRDELKRVNTFRKARLAYALKYRTTYPDSILYRIRNGKSFATGFATRPSQNKRYDEILEVVLESIVEDVRNNVDGKKVFIPENIHYALPTTEKMFTGDLPSGTYVTVPKEMIFGVHWTDVDGHRIDLDLSLIDCDGGKVGWDADYRRGGGEILFSGDMTSAPAPKGASELFYIERQKKSSAMMVLNYFNHDEDVEVPISILVAKEKVDKLEHNHMVDPNKVVCMAKSKISEKQKVLGLLVTTPAECRFYFAETALGNSITSYSGKDYVQQARKYLFNFYENTIQLYDILEKAGAIFVEDPKKADIDLSYEKIERDSLIKLLTKTNGRKD